MSSPDSFAFHPMATIYQVDRNGAYVGDIDLTTYIHPIPLHVTVKPPAHTKRQTPIWRGKKWELVTDYKAPAPVAPAAAVNNTRLLHAEQIRDRLQRAGKIGALAEILRNPLTPEQRQAREEWGRGFFDPSGALATILRAQPFSLSL